MANDTPRTFLEFVPIDSLVPDPLNPRKMSDRGRGELAESLTEFGLVEPIVARRSDRLIISGHQRVKTARLLGMTEVSVIWWEGDDRKARALSLALNRIRGDWDEAKLGDVLASLARVESLEEALLGFDPTFTSLAGFDEREVLALLPHDFQAEKQEDLVGLAREMFAPEHGSSIREGTLFALGPHRILCGDSRDPVALRRLCGGIQPTLVFTDPPYGVAYSPESGHGRPASSGRMNGRHKRRLGSIEGDDLPAAEHQAFISDVLANAAEAAAPVAAFYVFGGTTTTSAYDAAFATAGLVKSSILIWDKGSFSLGRKDYQSQYELIYYGWKKGGKHVFLGERTESDIWQIPRDASAGYIHPTQKPVALAARALKNSSQPGDSVLDLFGGSGSTMAAEQSGRRALLMELDPHFVEVAIRRWESFSGQRVTQIAEVGDA